MPTVDIHLTSFFLSAILYHAWEEPTHWKRPWCWESLKAEGEEGDRGRDGRMASLIRWT